MQELRGKRGLNYGDYSYIEYWDNAAGTSNPPPNHPRGAADPLPASPAIT